MTEQKYGTLTTARSLPEHDTGILPSSRMYLHLPSETAKSTLYYAPYIGHFFLTPSYVINRDNYDYYLFILIENGELQVQYGGQTFVARARDIVLIDCKKPHAYRALCATTFRYFHFDGCSSAAFYDMLTAKHGYCIHLAKQVAVESAMVALLGLAYNGLENEFKISAQIHIILSELLSQDTETDHPQDALITEAISYMEKRFNEPMTVKELSDVVGLSPYYFSRLFRKYTNLSPHAYLINLRITFARDLLASSQHSIEQVADRCGFNSIQHFIRCFRQHVGCSPREYRKQTAGSITFDLTSNSSDAIRKEVQNL